VIRPLRAAERPTIPKELLRGSCHRNCCWRGPFAPCGKGGACQCHTEPKPEPKPKP
jgi:hypothetical protein